MKQRNYLLLTLAVLLPLAVMAASTTYAQSLCGLQVGSASATTQYNGSSYGMYNNWGIQLTLPISTNCPNVGDQLFAVANAYDSTSNTNLGSANVAMTQSNGYFSGELVFTLPPSVVEHPLQIQISTYSSYANGQYQSLVGTATQTVTIHGNGYSYSPPAAWNGYYNSYPESCNYQNGYMYCYYPAGGYYYYYSSPYYYTSSCNGGRAVIYYNGHYHSVACYHR